MAQTVVHSDRTFVAPDGQELFVRYCVPDVPKATFLLLHGVHEHSGRYLHVMEAFARAGVLCCAPDHRGHGRTSGQPGYIDDLDDVSRDIGVLHEQLCEAHPLLTRFIFGHSLGGLLAIREALRSDVELSGLVLCAPAVVIPDYVSPLLLFVGRLLSALVPRLGVQRFFDPERVSQDPEVRKDIVADPFVYKKWFRARTGWEILRAMKSIEPMLNELTAPLLVLHGGADEVAPVKSSTIVVGRASSTDKTLIAYPGLRHELHNEIGRDEIIAAYVRWVEERA